MIIVRHTFRPSANANRFVEACVRWRDAHPDDGWTICQSVTGKQQVVIMDLTYADHDHEGICSTLLESDQHWTPEFAAWVESTQDLDMTWDTREVLRLV